MLHSLKFFTWRIFSNHELLWWLLWWLISILTWKHLESPKRHKVIFLMALTQRCNSGNGPSMWSVQSNEQCSQTESKERASSALQFTFLLFPPPPHEDTLWPGALFFSAKPSPGCCFLAVCVSLLRLSWSVYTQISKHC